MIFSRWESLHPRDCIRPIGTPVIFHRNAPFVSVQRYIIVLLLEFERIWACRLYQLLSMKCLSAFICSNLELDLLPAFSRLPSRKWLLNTESSIPQFFTYYSRLLLTLILNTNGKFYRLLEVNGTLPDKKTPTGRVITFFRDQTHTFASECIYISK